MSKDGIYIDPDRVKEISDISLPHNKKSMQSFLGQINFVKIFIPDFSQIVLPMQNMINKIRYLNGEIRKKKPLKQSRGKLLILLH